MSSLFDFISGLSHTYIGLLISGLAAEIINIYRAIIVKSPDISGDFFYLNILLRIP